LFSSIVIVAPSRNVVAIATDHKAPGSFLHRARLSTLRLPREDELVLQKVRYDAFYGTHLDHFLHLWDVESVVICGTVTNICVHYTAASAALRWYKVVIPRDAVSALEPFDLESSLHQTTSLFAGDVTTCAGIRLVEGHR
jgi:nicotinamidase-related amidase